jgi:hypothetical protein
MMIQNDGVYGVSDSNGIASSSRTCDTNTTTSPTWRFDYWTVGTSTGINVPRAWRFEHSAHQSSAGIVVRAVRAQSVCRLQYCTKVVFDAIRATKRYQILIR